MPKINITKHLGFTPANTAKGNLMGFTLLNNRRANLTGFTLIELLVVISIIGFLASMAIFSLNVARTKAQIAKVESDVRSIYSAFQMALIASSQNYLDANGGTTGENVWYEPECGTPYNYGVGGNDRPNGQYVNAFSSVLQPYLANIPKDPWGYQYWIDAMYLCTSNIPESCTPGKYYYVIGSGGKNGSAPNIYDADNVVVSFCRQP